MRSHPQHHIHLLGHLSLAVLGILGSIGGFLLNSTGTSAQVPTLFQGYFSGRDATQATGHWNYGGNDFEGKVYWGTHQILPTPATVTLGVQTKSCTRQVRGLYYNSARGQVLWPLDQGSLDALRILDASYDDLSIDGGLYIGCNGDTTHVFGQVTHTINSLERKLVAGVAINTGTNSYTHTFANSLTFSGGNSTGYIVDSIGSVADISGSAPLYTQDAEPAIDICPNGDNSGSYYDGICNAPNICQVIETVFACTIDPYGLMGLCPIECASPRPTQTGDVFTGTQQTIIGTGNSGDIITITVPGGQVYTGIIGSGGVFEIPVILVVGSNQILVTITNPETEETIETSITVTVVPTPVIDNCPNGDYTGDLYDEQCGQAPEQENPQPRRSRDSKAVIMTDEDLGICEEGEDNSTSYYDRKCGDTTHKSADEKTANPTIDNTFDFIKEVGVVMKSMTCNISQELVEAYVFGRSMNMTTVTNICNANLMGPLRRKEMAKFSSMFDLKALAAEPDKTRACTFNDTDNESDEMKAFIQLSCELGNMGLHRDGSINDSFRPNDKVTIAEFATLVSRMMFGSEHNTPENDPRPWYGEHTKALYKAGIMTQIDKPSNEQLRGYALIVFKRVYEMLNK